MRRLSWLALSGILLIVGLVVGFVTILPVKAEISCGLESVRGRYAIYGTGWAAGTPFAMVGTWIFDGQGHVSGRITDSYGGTIGHAMPVQGNYSVNSDCAGSATISEQHETPRGMEVHRLTLVIASGGQRVMWILTDTDFHADYFPKQPMILDPTVTISGFLEPIN